MNSYDVYGRTRGPIGDACRTVQEALGVQLEERESDFEGGVYYRHGDEMGENILIRKNIDLYDGQPAVAKLARYPVLLYVNNTNRSADIRALIEHADEWFALVEHNGTYLDIIATAQLSTTL